jgi:hypothetical protein
VFEIRRVLTHVEDIFHEFGPPPAQPLRKGAIAAVMTNPFAGRYEPKIEHAMEALKPIGIGPASACRDGRPACGNRELRQGSNRRRGG